MSSQVAYSVWPPATARGDRQPGLLDAEPLGGRPRVAPATPDARCGRCRAAVPRDPRRCRGPPCAQPPRSRAPASTHTDSGRDQDRGAGGRPAGAAVGELERERERIERRAVAPVVDRRARLRGRFPGDARRARAARACRAAAATAPEGRSRACLPGWPPLSPPGVRCSRRAAWPSSPRRLCSCQSLLVSCSRSSALVSVTRNGIPGRPPILIMKFPRPGGASLLAARSTRAGPARRSAAAARPR